MPFLNPSSFKIQNVLDLQTFHVFVRACCENGECEAHSQNVNENICKKIKCCLRNGLRAKPNLCLCIFAAVFRQKFQERCASNSACGQ